MRCRSILLVVVGLAVLGAGCATNKPAGSADRARGRTLRVVATTQAADFAANVGGDRVQVTGLLKPNLDAHDYEPSPADLQAIARADVVLENGAGLESWLGDTITSSGFQGPVVDTSQGVRLRQLGGQPDPHIWQNPRNAMVMAGNIEHALAAADPADAGDFQANLAAYTSQLQALDVEVQRQLDSLANKKLVTNHDAFGHYIDPTRPLTKISTRRATEATSTFSFHRAMQLNADCIEADLSPIATPHEQPPPLPLCTGWRPPSRSPLDPILLRRAVHRRYSRGRGLPGRSRRRSCHG